MTANRYVVTELEGWFTPHGSKSPGVSVHVIDTLDNRRLVATYRSDEHNQQRSKVREWAADRCAELNASRKAAMPSTGQANPS